MLSRPDFNLVLGTAIQYAPAAALGLTAALSQVSTNGVAAFAMIYAGVCQAGGATTDMRTTWKNIALSCYLPQEFIDIL
jgi:hypothetical protein